MKVNELRNQIAMYNSSTKDKIIVELYKRISKQVKEEYNIDDYIMNANVETKVEKPKPAPLTIEELKKDIEYFIDCVNQDLYCHRNKIIPNKERSNWRFKVKKYYKELTQIPSQTKEGKIATDLLKNLYFIISTGSTYLLFPNYETFRAIGIRQDEFLETIVIRTLSTGHTEENVNYCINLLTASFDPYELSSSLLKVMQQNLTTDELRTMAIESLKELAKKTSSKAKVSYDDKKHREKYAELVLYLSINLNKISTGIKYYQQNNNEFDKEVIEYKTLDILEDFGLYEEWVEEYESHLGKIKYRDSLQEKYQQIKSKL